MSEPAMPDSAPLSVEQAVAALAPETAPEAPIQAAEEPENPEGETITPEEAPAEPEKLAEGEEAEAEPEAVEPVEPPKYWSTDAKAKFALLDPELQAVVLEQEGPREEATAKAKAQAAAEVEKAQKDMAGVQALANQLAEFLPQAVETFKQRWGEPDWAAVAQEHGADQAFVLKAQFEAEQKQLARVQDATQIAQREAHKAFLNTEWKALATLAPELAPDVADPAKGSEVRQKVVNFLGERGIPQDAISQISAVELSLAHDAMRWREAQAALKAKPALKPALAVAAKSPVRPAAAIPQASSQRTATQFANRFAQTRSIEDAVALLMAKG